jgi:hypothetical protein
MMRRILLLGGVIVLIISNGGCFLPIYDSEPNRRVQQLFNTSEDLRQIRDEWSRFWFTDQPSHMTPERVHGGIQ